MSFRLIKYIHIYIWVEKVDSNNPTKTNCRISMVPLIYQEKI